MQNKKNITNDDYKKIISIWEWDYCDYKSVEIKPSDLEKSLVAFANKDWWKIYVWIREDKAKKEFFLQTNKIIEDYNKHTSMFGNIKPTIEWLEYNFLSFSNESNESSKYKNEENAIFLEIIIPSSNEVHSTSDNSTYERRWAQNIKLSADEIKKLLDRKKEKQKSSVPEYESNIANINNSFMYDFEKFSDSFWFILKCIERVNKNDFTRAEINKFYESLSKNNIYTHHFFRNLWTLNSTELLRVIEKLVYPFIKNNKDYDSVISIISYLENYIEWKYVNIILKTYFDILERIDEEFIFRKVAIILSSKKMKSFDISLMLSLVCRIIEKWYRLPHDFIVEFLSKNIDKFSSYEIESIMNLFDFDWTWSEKLITINSSIREQKYLPDIFSKMLYIDYKVTFKYFWKLLKLFYENDKYSVSSRKLIQINRINHIGYYSFPEVTLSSKLRRNNLQENIFIILWKVLIKLWKSSKKREFYEEVVSYIIDNWDYSTFYELISFTLVSNKNKNLYLIRKLVNKKEILPFINIFQQRWWIEIFTYLFSKEDDYIEEFEKYVIENEELSSHEYQQIYLLSTIPKSKLSKRWEQFIYSFLSKNEWYKIIFRDKPSLEVTTWSWRQEPLSVKLEKREKLEDIYKKSDLVLEIDKWWDLYDYKWIFEEYFKNNLDQIKDVYSYIAWKWEEAYILASMPIIWFLEHAKEKYKDTIDISFYKDLVDIYFVIKDDDRHSKLEIWRLLDDNEFLKREFTWDILNIDKSIYEWIKRIVLDLASNKEPDKDSENDGLSLWLNTVRWLWTIIIPILFYYYPGDDDLKNKIVELSNDKLYGIQSTLIANIPWLLKDNKKLLISILSKYIYIRNKIIDQSLVNYCIDRLWYVENKDLYVKLLNWLLKSDDKDIQNKTWELLWYVILSGLQNQNEDSIKEYMAILDDILSKKNWTHESMLWFWFAIQKNIISIPEVLEKKIELITYILDSYEELSLDEYSNLTYRLSFLFYKDNFLPEYFDIFYEKEVFQKLISKSKSLESFWNINEFLKEILESRWLYVVDRIKNLMKLQVDTNKGLFHAHSFTHLEDLLTIIYEKYDWKNCKICNMIFEKGLEIWYKTYIEIYNKYYKE